MCAYSVWLARCLKILYVALDGTSEVLGSITVCLICSHALSPPPRLSTQPLAHTLRSALDLYRELNHASRGFPCGPWIAPGRDRGGPHRVPPRVLGKFRRRLKRGPRTTREGAQKDPTGSLEDQEGTQKGSLVGPWGVPGWSLGGPWLVPGGSLFDSWGVPFWFLGVLFPLPPHVQFHNF
jgi:hypothetical protein